MQKPFVRSGFWQDVIDQFVGVSTGGVWWLPPGATAALPTQHPRV